MVGARETLVAVGTVALIGLLSSTGGCGAKNDATGFDPAGSGVGEDGSVGPVDDSGSGPQSGNTGGPIFSSPDAGASAACAGGGLNCYVKPGCATNLTGTVYDPAGVNPLYNAVVFIPNDPHGALTAIHQGTNSCNTCDVSIGDYVTATTSDANGNFTLNGVPATTHVPLVVQIGKWRREVFLSSVTACTTSAIPGSSLTRLPAKRSEGDLPEMALVTGGADNLGCFLKGIGLDPSEYSAPHAGGRLDIYQGLPAAGGRGGFGGGGGGGAPGLSSGTAGDCTTDNPNCVWNSKPNFEAYDIVLLSCEGDTFDPDDSDADAGRGGGGRGGGFNKSSTAKQALHDWLNEGGKVFATHFHYTWFKNSPAAEFRTVATWLGTSNGNQMGLYNIDTTFPKGVIFNQWLSNVKALTGAQIQLSQVAQSVSTVSAAAQRWIYDSPANSNDVKYMSFLTPIGGKPMALADGGEGPPAYCGKAVFSDLHAGGSPAGAIPQACAGPPLSEQEKALEFLFFDLSACVSNDSLPPPNVPPPTK